MPSRLLREGILDSDAVNSLSWPAEVFYRRLMSVVDDYGRFDGRLEVLRSRLYALKLEDVRAADVERWIAECEKAGLIRCYAVDSKPYILFHKLGTPRAAQPKFPDPPDYNGLQPFTGAPNSYSGSDAHSGAGARSGPPPPKVPRSNKSKSQKLAELHAKRGVRK